MSEIIIGNCVEICNKQVKPESVQCCVTSIPYWGLRKYAGAQECIWGGREDCQHQWLEVGGGLLHENRNFHTGTQAEVAAGGGPLVAVKENRTVPSSTCLRCGAWYGAFGLEPSVELFVEHVVEVLQSIWRVLRSDGVVFLNVGDSYSNDTKWGGQSGGKNYTSAAGDYQGQRRKLNSFRRDRRPREDDPHKASPGLKPKDLCLVPFRVALAAQAAGWWARKDIIWHKPNPMPESVKDRPTTAHEYIFMLTKSESYYWDADAVREAPLVIPPAATGDYGGEGFFADNHNLEIGRARNNRAPRLTHPKGCNLRSVWTIPTERMDLECCTRCEKVYSGAEYRRLALRIDGEIKKRVCRQCGGTEWTSHFAAFPRELAKRCILSASRPGDLVLDPFAGSGTTLEQAQLLGREYLGIDISANYLPLMRRRLAAVSDVQVLPFEQEGKAR